MIVADVKYGKDFSISAFRHRQNQILKLPVADKSFNQAHIFSTPPTFLRFLSISVAIEDP